MYTLFRILKNADPAGGKYMFCTQCGAKYEGEEKFCPVCGAAFDGTAKTEVDAPESESLENSENIESLESLNEPAPTADGFYAGSAPMSGVPSYMSEAEQQAKTPETAANKVPQGSVNGAFSVEPDGAFCAAEPPKKKKSAGKIVGYTAAALLVVALLLVGVFFPYISNFVAKATMSPEKYMQRVLRNNAQSGSSAIALSYDTLVGTYWAEEEVDEEELDYSVSRELTASLEVSDTAIKMDEGLNGTDNSWLNGLYANAVISTAGKGSIDKRALDLTLGRDDTEVVRVSIVNDAENGDGYISVPSYNDKYLHIKDGNIFAGLEEVSETEAEVSTLPSEKPEFLPDTDTFYYMLIRYSNALINAIDEAEKSNEVLEVGELSKKLTVLETKIASDDMAQMLKNVLEELKNDEDMKALMEGFYEYMGEEFSYDDMCDDLEKYIAELEEDEDEDEIVLKIWVDGKGDITAWDLSLGESMSLRIAAVSKGNAFAAEASIEAEEMHLSASVDGEVKDNILTANAAISGKDGGLINIEVSDCDVRKFGTPYAEGKIVITPGDYAREYIAAEIKNTAMETNSYSPEKIDNFDVRLEINISGGQCDAELFAGTESATFASLKLTYTVLEEPLEIVIPTGDNVLDADDPDESALWYESFDMEKLTETFEKAGVPEDLVYNLIYGGYYDEEYSAYDFGYAIGYQVGSFLEEAYAEGEEAQKDAESGILAGNDDFRNEKDYDCPYPDGSYFETGYDIGYTVAYYTYMYSQFDEYDEFYSGYTDGIMDSSDIYAED